MEYINIYIHVYYIPASDDSWCHETSLFIAHPKKEQSLIWIHVLLFYLSGDDYIIYAHTVGRWLYTYIYIYTLFYVQDHRKSYVFFSSMTRWPLCSFGWHGVVSSSWWVLQGDLQRGTQRQEAPNGRMSLGSNKWIVDLIGEMGFILGYPRVNVYIDVKNPWFSCKNGLEMVRFPYLCKRLREGKNWYSGIWWNSWEVYQSMCGSIS